MVLKIGHRGARGYFAENTLSSFKKAIELQVDVIELDVQMCKCGELVLIHDNKLDRMTNGSGYVKDKNFIEIENLKINETEKITTLRESLNLINRRAMVNIELKGTNAFYSVSEIIKEYVNKHSWSYSDFFVSSFNHYELAKFKKVNPKVRIGAIMEAVPINYSQFAERINADFVVLEIECVSNEFVKDSHNRGLKVFVYTVNDFDEIERIKSMNVDGIISDYPDRL